jgi:hypothetical protein
MSAVLRSGTLQATQQVTTRGQKRDAVFTADTDSHQARSQC